LSLLLLAPVTVTVEPIDPGQATDALAREGTLRKAWRAPITLECQLDYRDRSSQAGDIIGGGDEVHRAELTFDRDLARQSGWQPRMGDRITAATDDDGYTDPAVLYVLRSIPRGYWFGGVATTLVVECVDRFPERQAEA
jgi:hypothetical protein